MNKTDIPLDLIGFKSFFFTYIDKILHYTISGCNLKQWVIYIKSESESEAFKTFGAWITFKSVFTPQNSSPESTSLLKPSVFKEKSPVSSYLQLFLSIFTLIRIFFYLPSLTTIFPTDNILSSTFHTFAFNSFQQFIHDI